MYATRHLSFAAWLEQERGYRASSERFEGQPHICFQELSVSQSRALRQEYSDSAFCSIDNRVMELRGMLKDAAV